MDLLQAQIRSFLRDRVERNPSRYRKKASGAVNMAKLADDLGVNRSTVMHIFAWKRNVPKGKDAPPYYIKPKLLAGLKRMAGVESTQDLYETLERVHRARPIKGGRRTA